MKVITRKEAKEQGLKRYFTGKPCKHGHVSERFVSDGSCVDCSRSRDAQTESRERRKKYYAANREKISKYRKKYRDENREEIAQKAKTYRDENREQLFYQKKKYYAENRASKTLLQMLAAGAELTKKQEND